MSEGAFYLIRSHDEWRRYKQGLLDHTESLILEGPVFIKVARYTHPRSLSQNDMWRGLCREIADYWNANNTEQTNAEAVARDLKVTYGIIKTEYSPITGKRAARIESTAKYSSKEMGDLITATLSWAADNKIPLEDPRNVGTQESTSLPRNHAAA